MSNLPPGVNVNMIPGNRPEDSADEEFLEALDRRFAEENPEVGQWGELPDDFVEPIWRFALLARDMGYTAGRQDAEMEHQLEREVSMEQDAVKPEQDSTKYRVRMEARKRIDTSKGDTSIVWDAVVYRPGADYYHQVVWGAETKEEAEQAVKTWVESDRLSPELPDTEEYTL